jgi:hypothetical protein
MYEHLYASVVKGYVGFYGEKRAHTIAMWMMGIFTTANIVGLFKFAGIMGIDEANSVFRALTFPLYASALLLSFVGLHIVLGTGYRKRSEETGSGLFENSSRLLGDIYTFGSVVFWILLSRLGDSA